MASISGERGPRMANGAAQRSLSEREEKEERAGEGERDRKGVGW